jgi:hypothetical protein
MSGADLRLIPFFMNKKLVNSIFMKNLYFLKDFNQILLTIINSIPNYFFWKIQKHHLNRLILRLMFFLISHHQDSISFYFLHFNLYYH